LTIGFLGQKHGCLWFI